MHGLLFPNEEHTTCLMGAVLMEVNDEWQLQQRYMQIEAMAEFASPRREARPPDHTEGHRP